MNLSKFLFKFVIICTYILRVGLLILPIATVGVLAKEGGWKYGFTFIQNNMSVALFISFALAFLISLYHAVSFEEIEGAPDENFMKANQQVKVDGVTGINEVHQYLLNHKTYKNVHLENGILRAQRKVHLLNPDKIEIKKEGSMFVIHSRPFALWWFVDFGRNYKNVKEIATFIKKEK
jgi:hypothetical protein